MPESPFHLTRDEVAAVMQAASDPRVIRIYPEYRYTLPATPYVVYASEGPAWNVEMDTFRRDLFTRPATENFGHGAFTELFNEAETLFRVVRTIRDGYAATAPSVAP